MKIRFGKEFQIGTLVIATIAILYFGINYLKGINIFNPTNYYHVKFDRVDGLSPSNPVLIKGYKIGFVKSINYNYDDPSDGIIVTLEVDDQLRIPVGSKAVLRKELFGSSSLMLELNSEVHRDSVLKKGDFISAKIEEGVMDQMTAKVEHIVPKVDSLLTSLQSLVSNKSIEKSLQSVEQLTANLESTSLDLSRMMKKDIPDILGNVNTLTADFSKVSGNLSQIDFNATVQKLDQMLADLQMISDKINEGEGSLGLLINDKSFYNNLNATMESANKLLIDLKANPKRYVQFSVFGKSDKK